jgi:SAM-dependent methyltransferase
LRVSTENLPRDNWHHFLRLRDLEQLKDHLDLPRYSKVLELGAGDGVQTGALRAMFDDVIPIDVDPSGVVEGLIVADAADLPFEDSSFDVIFSSNVLEHVEDLDSAFAEMKRVLKPGGIMIHTMPTSIWKLAQLLLRPVASLVKIAQRLVPGLRKSSGRAVPLSHGEMPRVTRSLVGRVVGLVIPTIHGTSGNHISELLEFSARRWRRKFDATDLELKCSDPLYLHSPYDLMPYRLLALRDLLGKLGLCSVRAYVLVDPA